MHDDCACRADEPRTMPSPAASARPMNAANGRPRRARPPPMSAAVRPRAPRRPRRRHSLRLLARRPASDSRRARGGGPRGRRELRRGPTRRRAAAGDDAPRVAFRPHAPPCRARPRPVAAARADPSLPRLRRRRRSAPATPPSSSRRDSASAGASPGSARRRRVSRPEHAAMGARTRRRHVQSDQHASHRWRRFPSPPCIQPAPSAPPRGTPRASAASGPRERPTTTAPSAPTSGVKATAGSASAYAAATERELGRRLMRRELFRGFRRRPLGGHVASVRALAPASPNKTRPAARARRSRATRGTYHLNCLDERRQKRRSSAAKAASSVVEPRRWAMGAGSCSGGGGGASLWLGQPGLLAFSDSTRLPLGPRDPVCSLSGRWREANARAL